MQRQRIPDRRDLGPGRQRGFVLIIVILIVLLLVGLAGMLLSSAQTDLRTAAVDREANLAFYAAEAGVANGKDFLFNKTTGVGAGSWNAVLTSGAVQLCQSAGGSQPGTVPQLADPTVAYDTAHGTSYQFCIHNNAIDTYYIPPAMAGDTKDSDGVITIESYGYGPIGAKSHLTVDVLASYAGLVGSDQAQGGGSPLKQGSSDAPPTASGVTSSRSF